MIHSTLVIHITRMIHSTLVIHIRHDPFHSSNPYHSHDPFYSSDPHHSHDPFYSSNPHHSHDPLYSIPLMTNFTHVTHDSTHEPFHLLTHNTHKCDPIYPHRIYKRLCSNDLYCLVTHFTSVTYFTSVNHNTCDHRVVPVLSYLNSLDKFQLSNWRFSTFIFENTQISLLDFDQSTCNPYVGHVQSMNAP